MKICFLGPAGNYHIEKWCKWFIGRGHDVDVISFSDGSIAGAHVHCLQAVKDPHSATEFRKMAYLLQGKRIRELVESIKPDVISVHYASSYGTAAALSGIGKYTLSVWGSDVYEFPQKGLLHQLMLRYSMSRASRLFSTSRAMADECGKYTKKPFEITPFGVDMELFSPGKRQRSEADGDFIVGTVKTLSPKYGIDYLLKAAAIVINEHPEIPLRLRIAGKGEAEGELKQLAKQLGLEGIVTWLGFIPQEQAAVEWVNMDLAVTSSSSSSESFGVSAVEAQSCGVPIIVSDVPGLMEATSPGHSSVVVPRMNERALADAIVALYADPERRRRMGEEGRRYVLENYELNNCFLHIEQLLRSAGGYLED